MGVVPSAVIQGCHQPVTCPLCAILGSLASNQVCGIDHFNDGTYTAKGINALCEALKDNKTLTSLKYAHQLEYSSNLPTNSVNSH